jgi:RHS repeat-associated protein
VDEVLTRTDADGTHTLLTDALGSTLELANEAGTLQTHYTFEPFGATVATGATSSNPVQFAGRENDNTGLYSYRARYFNVGLSRFISEDPIEFGGGEVNLYAYAAGNPLNNIDPTGCSFIGLCEGAR